MLGIDNLPHELLLGRQTEKGVTVISIDVQSWLDQWPGMEIVIMATRPGESAAYPAATRMDGSCIVWTVNGADTAIAGRGTAEILGLVDGVRKLSQIVRTRIKASIVGSTMEPPEGAQPWVDEVIDAANEIKNMTAQAETLKPGDSATASYADGKLTLGIPRGLPGGKGDKGDTGDTGPKGDPGSDASVTAANIEAALGYAPVKDVQVGGTSVLDGGVAKVPNAICIRGDNSIGVVNPPQRTVWEGLIGIAANTGKIILAQSTPLTINNRNPQFVGGGTLDYAVKAAMCDGKGAAWTEDEQKAARDRMGVQNNVNVTAESIQSALGYTPGKTLAPENYNGQIENLFPDKITIIINNFWRYGDICQFVVQFNVTENITSEYGFMVFKLPFKSAMRCWLNNSTDYYIDPSGQYIKRNDERIYSGSYILSGVYITNNAAFSAVEATALMSTNASFPIESKVDKVRAKMDTLENTTDDIVLMMADLIGGGD